MACHTPPLKMVRNTCSYWSWHTRATL